MTEAQQAAINHFIDADLGRLSSLIWEHWQLTGKVPAHDKPVEWERRPLIDSWYDSLTRHAATLGVDSVEIDRRLTLLLGRPFKVKDFRKV
jgi:hypothetical protein